MENMSIDEIWDYSAGRARIFVVRGELDAHLSTDLLDRLEDALADPPEALLIDLEDVTFMDASALGDLVTVFKEARAAGTTTRLVAPSAAVKRLLCHTRTESVFPTEGNLISAYGGIAPESRPNEATEHNDAA